jgi:hypothetical protein
MLYLKKKNKKQKWKLIDAIGTIEIGVSEEFQAVGMSLSLTRPSRRTKL